MYAAMVSLVGMKNGFSVRIVVAPCAANAKPLARSLRKEVMYQQEKKPPIGIMPERIWKQKRAEELTEAIARYVSARVYENAERTVIAWCHELESLVRDLEAG